MPIPKEEMNAWVYSGVRKVNRPVLGSLHAAVALGYMICFCKGVSELKHLDTATRNQSNIYLKEYAGDLKDGLQALANTKLTPIGQEIYKDLSSLLK